MTDRWYEEARRVAAELFNVDEQHIIEAPRHCGNGWEGECDGNDCQAVQAVSPIAALARSAHREGLERAAQLATEICEEYRYHPCGCDIAAAIRREIEEWL